MKMKFCLLALVSMMICNCSNRRFADSSVVSNSIDSILKANTKAGHFGVSETFWEDDSFYGQRRKQWIFTDSIESTVGCPRLRGMLRGFVDIFENLSILYAVFCHFVRLNYETF